MIILFFLCIAVVALGIIALYRSASTYDLTHNPQSEARLRWCGKASTAIAS